MIGLMVVILMVFYTCGKLVLRRVGPILGNGQKPPDVFYNREAFSCGFCEISKKTFFPEHLWATASKWVWNLGTIAPGK